MKKAQRLGQKLSWISFIVQWTKVKELSINESLFSLHYDINVAYLIIRGFKYMKYIEKEPCLKFTRCQSSTVPHLDIASSPTVTFYFIELLFIYMSVLIYM